MAKVRVEVYGCSANQADAEIVSGLLAEAGHTLVDKESEVTILLTCIVKTPTEMKIRKHIRVLISNRERIVIAGCMPKALRSLVEYEAPNAVLVGPDDIARMPEAVDAALKREKRIFLQGSSPEKTCLPRARINRLIHIAPISSGCLGNCSYCIVKVARGKLHSYPADEIISDAEEAVRSGCKEIWVTAEDTAAYNYKDVKLPELILRMSEIHGRFMIRIGMMTPNSADAIMNDLKEVYSEPKVFKFLHVPVQSGSNVILSRMRRMYTVEQLKRIVLEFRESVPQINISTDVICGFPGEIESEYEESLRLIEWLKPDVLNISRFWPRPETEAADFPKQLPGWKTKERSRRMDALWHQISIEVNRKWLNWEGDVLLDEEGYGGRVVGRNSSYKAIAIITSKPVGEWIKTKIIDIGRGYLLGEEIISRM